METHLLEGIAPSARDAQIVEALASCRRDAERGQGVTHVGLCNEAGEIYRGLALDSVDEFVAVYQALTGKGWRVINLMPGRNWQLLFG